MRRTSWSLVVVRRDEGEQRWVKGVSGEAVEPNPHPHPVRSSRSPVSTDQVASARASRASPWPTRSWPSHFAPPPPSQAGPLASQGHLELVGRSRGIRSGPSRAGLYLYRSSSEGRQWVVRMRSTKKKSVGLRIGREFVQSQELVMGAGSGRHHYSIYGRVCEKRTKAYRG